MRYPPPSPRRGELRRGEERRGEERRGEARELAAVFRALLLSGCIIAAPVAPGLAQTTGTWETGYLHQHDPNTGQCTNYLAAFNTDPTTNPTYVAPPTPLTQPFGWGTNIWSTAGNFNAIHMALIPKGPHRGKILVWNRFPVCLRPGAPYDTSNYWMFQGWSIIDPQWASGSGQPRFRNFLLPIEPYGTSPPTPPATFRSIFCSGHAWSQNGDLIVAGGATYDWQSSSSPPGERGANFLYLFDPSLNSLPFSGHTSPLYPNEVGAWKRNAADLLDDRYYPTVTLSQRLQRLGGSTGNPREVAMVSGGSDTSTHDPRNTYECWEPRVVTSTVQPFLIDPENPSASLPGPATGGGVNLHDEWFNEYPRIHLAGDGTMITSGWSHLSSKVNLDTTAATRAWDISVGRSGSSWQHEREYGSSVFFGALGSFTDIVVRLCGADANTVPITTASTEFCLATTTNAGWNTLGSDPAGGRNHINAVILPDASIVVIGGNSSSGSAVLTTSVYRQGVGWTALSSSGDSPTVRSYHATAVLMPDGYVFVGGGESHGSTVDYDVFKPHYLQANSVRPTIVSIVDAGSIASQDSEGTWLLENNQQGLIVECDYLEALDHVERVVLMAPGSITHHCDMTARYVELTSAPLPGSNTQRVFQLPNNNRLPRGYYMMFVLNSALVPSVASWVRIQ